MNEMTVNIEFKIDCNVYSEYKRTPKKRVY